MGIIPDPIPHQLHLSGGLFLLDLSHLPHLSGSAHSRVVMTIFMLLSFKFLFQMQASLLSSIQDIWPECLINMSNTDRSCHSSSQASSCPGVPVLLHGTLFTQPAEYHSWLVHLTHCSMLGCTYGQLYFQTETFMFLPTAITLSVLHLFLLGFLQQQLNWFICLKYCPPPCNLQAPSETNFHACSQVVFLIHKSNSITSFTYIL